MEMKRIFEKFVFEILEKSLKTSKNDKSNRGNINIFRFDNTQN